MTDLWFLMFGVFIGACIISTVWCVVDGDKGLATLNFFGVVMGVCCAAYYLGLQGVA